jgi:hypothetical protein
MPTTRIVTLCTATCILLFGCSNETSSPYELTTYTTTTPFSNYEYDYDSWLEIYNNSSLYTTDICLTTMGDEKWACDSVSISPGYYVSFAAVSDCYDIVVLSGESIGWEFLGVCWGSGDTYSISLLD